jgi:hypothetical protein
MVKNPWHGAERRNAKYNDYRRNAKQHPAQRVKVLPKSQFLIV